MQNFKYGLSAFLSRFAAVENIVKVYFFLIQKMNSAIQESRASRQQFMT